MVKKKDDNFMPSIAIPPGESIKESMTSLGMNQDELATRLGITTKHLSNVVNGNVAITYEMSLRLESVLGANANFWISLENQYQLNKARLKKIEELELEQDIFKEIPYKEMTKAGWIKKLEIAEEKIVQCREFFGVASLNLIKQSYQVMFRKQKKQGEISDMGVLAWLRQSEIESNKLSVKPFNKRQLKGLIPEFKKLTQNKPEIFYPKMQELCADCGVALVIVESIPKTYICGATIWRGDKVVLSLSVRGKRADIFWFTFFHELAHLITHTKKEFHISFDKDEEECEADEIASNWLINKEDYKYFLKNYNPMEKEDVINYANKLGISPCILVGRLMHDGVLDFKYHSDLRPSFKIKRNYN